MIVLKDEADLVEPEIGEFVCAHAEPDVLSLHFDRPGIRFERIPEIMLKRVVFPLPDGPTMKSISPR